MMTKHIALCCLLAAVTAASVRAEPGRSEISTHLIKAGLTDDGSATPPADTTVDPSQPCAGVSFSRGLKYGESDLNVLDVASSDSRDTSPRPVLMFVAGESFAGEGRMPADSLNNLSWRFEWFDDIEGQRTGN